MKIKPIRDERYKQLMCMPFITWSTFKRLRAVFPAQRGESAASYFERLAKHLEVKNG